MTATGPVVAVTGATGFVGRALCRRLLRDGGVVRALVRHAGAAVPEGCEPHVVGDLGQPVLNWAAALQGCQAVFHLAAIAHAPTQGDLWAVNVHATESLAESAFAAGCRLVYCSSIKVHGDAPRGPVDEDTAADPSDDYGRSKLAAEQAIADIARRLDGAWVALRPPIVYGVGDRGNFARLVGLACRGWPLPLAGVANRRSMIHVDALADALVAAARLDPLPGRPFVVAGGPALSTAQWLQLIASSAQRPLRLWHLPAGGLATLARLAGARHIAQRLLGSLEVVDLRWRQASGWQPPVTQGAAVADTVQWLQSTAR